jgi:pimeloyl-ACP methyl ester carboxylesterase
MQAELDTVTSADGTDIAVQVIGTGQSIILIGGAFNDRSTVAALAEALTPHATAATYDRRGRSASGDNGDSNRFPVQHEIEDLGAVISWVGGRASIFGHSSGAVLALEAASRGLPVDKSSPMSRHISLIRAFVPIPTLLNGFEPLSSTGNETRPLRGSSPARRAYRPKSSPVCE